MARPVDTRKRRSQNYARDIEVLQRLRSALFLDTTLPTEPAQKAIAHIDDLCTLLRDFKVQDGDPATNRG